MVRERAADLCGVQTACRSLKIEFEKGILLFLIRRRCARDEVQQWILTKFEQRFFCSKQKRNEQMCNKPLQFPESLHGPDMVVEVRLHRHLGCHAKRFLRVAGVERAPELFNRRIELTGREPCADESPINSVGRWLFGMPGHHMGYTGHLTVSNEVGTVAVLRFPQDSPDEVKALVAAVKQIVEAL